MSSGELGPRRAAECLTEAVPRPCVEAAGQQGGHGGPTAPAPLQVCLGGLFLVFVLLLTVVCNTDLSRPTDTRIIKQN